MREAGIVPVERSSNRTIRNTHRNMKPIITLFAVLSIASISFGADDAAKKPAEAGKAKPDPEAVFKKKDANNDGKVSKEEFLKGAKDAAKMEAAFTAKDKDKDGNLTLEEFKAAGGKKKKAA